MSDQVAPHHVARQVIDPKAYALFAAGDFAKHQPKP